ncbi:tRNA(His) guanylyltransferase [Rhizoctonia solani]|uniref:tRNA(His) guanylyltransferase n=1 Tax=Rhizoctonia solani TaxID=456999 RepID=A0A8H8P9R1_9AGAM|nr:tRNA(His) guanylyltransferase [Rhizoctonia solani]QRW26057.1 tRNA(His) guanylyltransferase [Rhizoctonia solani]
MHTDVSSTSEYNPFRRNKTEQRNDDFSGLSIGYNITQFNFNGEHALPIRSILRASRPLAPNTHLVLRIDGHAFHKFSDAHGFQKPNDERALKLMDHAAQTVMEEYPDIVLGFGESDEFRFSDAHGFQKPNDERALKLMDHAAQTVMEEYPDIVLGLAKAMNLVSYSRNRRSFTIGGKGQQDSIYATSLFTSAYVFNWKTHFPDTELKYPHHLMEEQADTHINNLYNTTFWALVQGGGMTAREAETRLKGTLSKDKHEILFSNYGINYNGLPETIKKGSVLVREVIQSESPEVANPDRPKGNVNIADISDPAISSQNVQDIAKNKPKRALPNIVRVIHVDIIKEEFWSARPELLDS